MKFVLINGENKGSCRRGGTFVFCCCLGLCWEVRLQQSYHGDTVVPNTTRVCVCVFMSQGERDRSANH